MLKFIRALMVLLLILTVGLATAFIALKPALDKRLQVWVKQTEGRGLEVNFFDYGKVRLSGLGILFKDIRARGITRFEHPYFDPREFEAKIGQVRLGVGRASLRGFNLRVQINGLDARGGRLLHEDREDSERLESVSKMDFQTNLDLSWNPRSWKAQALKRARIYQDWVFKDRAIRDLSMRGRAVFLVDDWPIAVRFHSVKNSQGDVHLEGNPEDLRVIAEMIEPKFTESDLKLASQNLTKMPKLLHIRREAEMRAIKLYDKNTDISYDTFRHVFWSYWITQAYGAEFARRTTDAHEIGDLTNSAAESEKDRHHNALGIDYAERKLTESQVEKMIFEDPRVMRLKKNKSSVKAQVALQKEAEFLLP